MLVRPMEGPIVYPGRETLGNCFTFLFLKSRSLTQIGFDTAKFHSTSSRNIDPFPVNDQLKMSDEHAIYMVYNTTGQCKSFVSSPA